VNGDAKSLFDDFRALFKVGLVDGVEWEMVKILDQNLAFESSFVQPANHKNFTRADLADSGQFAFRNANARLTESPGDRFAPARRSLGNVFVSPDFRGQRAGHIIEQSQFQD
jgi:hypothetical protein